MAELNLKEINSDSIIFQLHVIDQYEYNLDELIIQGLIDQEYGDLEDHDIEMDNYHDKYRVLGVLIEENRQYYDIEFKKK
ncbi:MAG: hypothetical protein ACFFCI_01045 [Promethearchaeota archaeon]